MSDINLTVQLTATAEVTPASTNPSTPLDPSKED